MKKLVLLVGICLFSATSAFAAGKRSTDGQIAVGAAYGLAYSGVLSVRGDYDISNLVNNQPVKVRVGWEHYSYDTGVFTTTYTWTLNVFFAGAYYDANEVLKLDKKIHPFAGLGFGAGSSSFSCAGTGCGFFTPPSQSVGGVYYIGGVQYNVTSNIDAELSYGAWAGISLGANYKF